MEDYYYAGLDSSPMELPVDEQSPYYALSTRFTPQAANTAYTSILENTSKSVTFDTTESNYGDTLDVPLDYKFSGTADSPWGEGQHIHASPEAATNLEDTNYLLMFHALESPLYLPSFNEQTTSSQIWSNDFLTSSSLPSISSVFATGQERRDSLCSHGSRTGSVASESHKRAISPLRQSKRRAKEGSEPFSCDECERTFSFKHKKDLERHKLSVHSRQPRWFCPRPACRFTKQGFSRKDKAFQHVRTHRDQPDVSLEPLRGGSKTVADTIT